jgi:lipid A 3-O-deacylase
MYQRVLLFMAMLAGGCLQAQVINSTYTYRDIAASGYVRYNYENDFFTATDELYTQGIQLEYAAPALQKLPTSKLLISPKNYTRQYKIALQHNAYTPQSIQDPSIRRGDHPYAAAFMLQFANTATGALHKLRISTILSAGVMGHIAGGDWMQKTIHRNLHNAMPQGWQYQIANDVVLNYNLQIEKQLLYINNIVLINGTASADAGTLLTQLSAGANIALGLFNNPYALTNGTLKYAVKLYTHPQLHAVGYNATMQGGFFGNSPYILAPGQIQRFVYDNRYGVVLQLNKLYVEYYYQNQSQTYTMGKAHSWGGFVIGLAF